MFNRFKNNGNNHRDYQNQNQHQQQSQQHGYQRKFKVRSTGLANGAGSKSSNQISQEDLLSNELRGSIKRMVINISKSFIVEWYTSISPTNHDFVEYCERLIEDALTKLAELSVEKLDKYKIGQLVVSLLHDHIIHENVTEKILSIEQQIDNYEYDICHNSVVRLFGLICTDTTKNLQDLSAKFNNNQSQQQPDDRTTSALYTLVVAMLTKSVFMPIVDQISNTKWLYAVIIRLCKEEDLEERAERRRQLMNSNSHNNNNEIPSTSSHPPIIVTSARGNRSLDLEEAQASSSSASTATVNDINLDNPNCDSMRKPLDNIEIYATEEVKSNKSCYVLYCIRYEGLCPTHPSSSSSQQDVPIIDKRVLNVTHRRVYSNITSSAINEQQASTSTAIPTTSNLYNQTNHRHLHSDSISQISTNHPTTTHSNLKYSRRTMTVKRRFREFVILQLRLEENPRIRPYMKNIPKPTKLKAATQSFFSGITNIKLDQSTIKLRKRFLERFLLALNSSPLIANSYEFKEFFSYSAPLDHHRDPSTSSAASSNISKSKLKSLNLVDSLRNALSVLKSSLPELKKSNEDLTSSPEAWQPTTNPLSNRHRHSQASAINPNAQQMQTITSQPKIGSNQFLGKGGGGCVGGDSNKLLSVPGADRSSRLKSASLDRRHNYLHVSNSMQTFGLDSRGGSLRPRNSAPESIATTTTKTNSASSYGLNRTSSSSSQTRSNTDGDFSSPSSSMESVYHDATDELLDSSVKDIEDITIRQRRKRNSSCEDPIQICDNIPIASKLIDVMHYSISKDHTSCSSSMINCIARRLLGKMIERHAIRLLEAAFTMDTATFCINGITSSIWDECDDDQLLDVENATLDEAVLHLTKLIESNYANYTLVPKQLVTSYVVSKQIRFYLSQLASQKRNKFVIYSFFVHLLDELELGTTAKSNNNQNQDQEQSTST